MKLACLAAVPAVLALGAVQPVAPPPAVAVDSPALVYGPGRCVSIKRTGATGTCVLRTDCPTQNIASFDFSFDCMSAVNGRTAHSLGIGSFDTQDEMDTGVACDSCLPPKGGPVMVPASSLPLVAAVAMPAKAASVAAKAEGATASHHTVAAAHQKVKGSHGTSLLQNLHHKKTRKAKLLAHQALLARHTASAAKARFHKESPEEKEEWSANSKRERYGPGGCVSTWLDEESKHCMMQTDCDEKLSADLAVYEFGLLCRQDDGDTVRHVFGQNSFDEHETFDTLIECQECLALDEYMDADSAVKQLADEVSDLRKTMSGVTEDLNKLNEAVLNSSAPAPAAAASPANASSFAARRGKGKVVAKAAQKSSKSHVHRVAAKVAAKVVAKATAHRGNVKKQQKRLLRHTAKNEQESQDEDMEEDGAEDEEVAVATKKVGRSQRKSKNTAQKTARKHRRETEDVEEDADSDEQVEEQDGDEADAQDDDQDEAQDEDGSRDDEQADDSQDEGHGDAPNSGDAGRAPDDEERSDSDA